MFATPQLNANTALRHSGASRRGRCAGAVAVWGLGILALAAAAPPARADARSSLVDPGPLSAELAVELQLVYRDNVPEFTRRNEQLRQAIAAWNASNKNATDRVQMSDWLHEAIRASMPGSAQQLPPVPTFASTDAKTAQPRTAQAAPNAEPLVPKSSADKLPAARAPADRHDASQVIKRLLPTESSSAGEKKSSLPATSPSPPDAADGDPFQDDAVPD